ncbi:MAG TPA: CBS domain-containing protein [Candidatus Bathyarchaeia archaeon]
MKLDEKRLFEILRELGLSRRETEIYLFLWKKGPQKAHSVAAYLDIDRAQIYRSLASLQEKGIVEVTLEAPTRYAGAAIEPLIESFIKTKKTEVASLETEKEDLINYFKSISRRETEQEYPLAKLQVIVGKHGIYSKITQMANEANKEFLGLTTSTGLIQEDNAGVLDTIIETVRKKRDIQFRMLTNISKDNLNITKRITKQISKNTNAEWRHTDLVSKFHQRFVIKDEDEAFLYLTSGDELSMIQEDTGLLITSRMFVSALRASFMEIWGNSLDAKERVSALETGTPIEETVIIKEAKDVQAKIEKILDTTNNVTLIMPPIGVNRILENDPFQKYSKKGVKFSVMTSIDLDNLEAAQRLSKLYQIKHVSISYLTMMMADSKHLFIFKAPTLEENIEYPFYLRNAFYTNDQKFVERANELLSDIWKRGTMISEIGSSAMGTAVAEVSSSDSVLKIADVMLKNSVSSVLVSDSKSIIGIVDQRDILEKVLKAGKDAKKTTAKEIMSTPVLTVDVDQPLIEALKIMKQKRIPRLAVVRNGNLVAVLT